MEGMTTKKTLVGVFLGSITILNGCGSAPPSIPADTSAPLIVTQTSSAAEPASITSGISCDKLTTFAGSSMIFEYESVIYSTGDRFVTCQLDAFSSSFFSSHLYPAAQNGATTGGCQFTADVSNAATGGYWTFSSQSGTTKAVYNDVGDVNNLSAVTFATGDCKTF